MRPECRDILFGTIVFHGEAGSFARAVAGDFKAAPKPFGLDIDAADIESASFDVRPEPVGETGAPACAGPDGGEGAPTEEATPTGPISESMPKGRILAVAAEKVATGRQRSDAFRRSLPFLVPMALDQDRPDVVGDRIFAGFLDRGEEFPGRTRHAGCRGRAAP